MATKYVSALNGQQMDAALTDMAYHTSEAFAIGERNGIPVNISDVTYQNNAKYYAQIATSHIDPGEIGDAVRWDTDQSTVLTDANKAQARKNIAAANTNPNLLRNWYFVNPVNSRGQTTYTVNATQHSIDGWYGINATSTHTLQNGEIVVSSSGFSVLGQELDNAPAGTYTLSLQAGSIGNTIVFYVYDANGGSYSATPTLSAYGIGSFTFTATAPIKNIRYYCDNGATFSARQAKLEVGTVSTLAQDAPPSYGEELTKCIYSKADPNEPYANTGFGRSNRNLLDNAYFVGGGSQLGDGVFPINQRGQTSYSGSGNIFDRWILQNAFANLAADAVYFGSTTQNVWGLMQQVPSCFRNLWGKTVTVSAILNNDELVQGTYTIPSSGAFDMPAVGSGGVFVNLYSSDGSNIVFRIYTQYTASYHIKAVKLELGTVSTLANDAPPDFGEELRKCQRWLWVDTFSANSIFASGVSFGQSCVFDLVTPVPMRKATTCTITFSATPFFIYNDQLLQVPAGATYAAAMNGNHIRMQIGTNGPDIGTSHHVDLLLGIETTVTVSCEP